VLSGSGPALPVAVAVPVLVFFAGTPVTVVVAVFELELLVGVAVTVWVAVGFGLLSEQAARATAQKASGMSRLVSIFFMVGPPCGSWSDGRRNRTGGCDANNDLPESG
jgi:hypothetical protein